MVQLAYYKRTVGKNEVTFARQLNKKLMSFDEVLTFMRQQSGLSKADMKSVFQHFVEHLAIFLPQGYSIQTPMGVFSISVQQPQVDAGTFIDSQPVTTDKVRIRLRGDQTLLNSIKADTNLKVLDTPTDPLPTVLRVETTESEGLNRGVPGEIIHIVGSRLSFSSADTRLGVFLVDATGQATRINVYSRIGGKLIDAKLPTLPAGNYRLEVRTSPGKALRTGMLNEPFTLLS